MDVDERTKRAVLRLKKKGLTYDEIADALGIVGQRLGVQTTRSSVIRFLHLLGFTLKKRSSSPRSEAGQTWCGADE